MKAIWGHPAALTLFAGALMVCSLVFSPFLLSISMWLFVLAGLWQAALDDRAEHARGRFSITGMFYVYFTRWFRRPELFLLSLLFLFPALSGWWSEDTALWWVRTRVRIPFFVLPMAFANVPVLPRRSLQGVIYLLFWVLFFTHAGVLINFAFHYDDIIAGLGRGLPVPVPRNHIRFSMMSASAVLLGGWLWADRFFGFHRFERPLFGVALVLLAVSVHILAVRSGLAVLYAGLLLTVCWLVFRMQTRVYGVVTLALLVMMPVIAWRAAPSFRKRVQYMMHDWTEYRRGAGYLYSDAQRWISLEAGIAVWRKHPLLGAGMGDLPAETKRYLEARHPQYAEQFKLPHNQFVYLLAATGLLGLLAQLSGMTASWFTGFHRRLYPFWVMQVVLWTSFLVEYTLETAVGAAFYLFFTLWFIHLGRLRDA